MSDCIKRSKIKLMKHQIEPVKFLQNHRGLILSYPMGSGKTLIAITSSQCYLDKNKKGKVVIVAPLSVLQNFKTEMKNYKIKNKDRYEILSYTAFTNKYKDKNKSSFKNKYLIIDEAHELRTNITKNKTSGKRARTALNFAKFCDKILLMTGTLMYNNPYDIANLIAMVRGEDPYPEGKFFKMMEDPKKIKSYFGERLMILSDKTKKKIMKGFPTFEEKYVRIKMTPSYYKEYRKVEQKKSEHITTKNPWVFFSGLRQATNNINQCLKCQAVIKLLQENKKKRFLIFSNFLDNGIKKLANMLKRRKLKYSMITGSTKKDDRQKEIEKYNSGKVRIMLFTRAGSLGLDLKNSDYVIIFESSWNKSSDQQTMYRAIRYGSHKNKGHVIVLYLQVIKPDLEKRDKKDISYESADTILEELSMKKEILNKRFFEKLKKVAIVV